MQIYSDKYITVRDLLSQAGADRDATLLIPDLQRPYVWQPQQVVLLVDSLLRGWPFGTLLTWSVSSDDPVNLLARPFYKIVDRTGVLDDVLQAHAQLPAQFQMVLDGQQRVQSLLLAFGEHDESGFRLLDRNWHEAIGGQRPRGRRGNPHWSFGCLCVDTEALFNQYREKGRISAIDFTEVLKWTITHPTNGRSAYRRPENYIDPLPVLSEHPSRFIRLSRLWRAVPPPNIDMYGVEGVVAALLNENEFDAAIVAERTRAISVLVDALRGVKETRVNYLELNRYNDDYGVRAEYDDAIVNIFTRLNTAGRTLTREDITFAWLKINWNTPVTDGKGAKECVDELLDELTRYDLKIEPEDAIGAISFMWSAAFGQGTVLRSSDLMRGDRIAPMAEQVSTNWSIFSDAIRTVTEITHRRGLSYRDQFQSLNALSYLWAIQFVGNSWQRNAQLNEPQRDSFDNQLQELVGEYIDRWLICSQWSGLWSRSTDVAVGNLAQRLFALREALAMATRVEDAVSLIRANLDREVNDQVADATQYIDALMANQRNQVRTYRVPLWVWNRINEDRWTASERTLRNATKRKPQAEVDHIIPFSIWQNRIAEHGAPKNYTIEEVESAINGLGNCMLLEKNFNISKGTDDLQTFMQDVHPFDNNPDQLPDWYEALVINQSLQSSRNHSLEDLLGSIEERTSSLRASLRQFVSGEVNRCDVD